MPEPITAGTLITLAAISALGGGMSAGAQAGAAGKASKEAIAQRNREMLASIAQRNKELRQQDERFRKTMELKRKESSAQASTSVLDTLSGIAGARRQPAGTADILASLIS